MVSHAPMKVAAVGVTVGIVARKVQWKTLPQRSGGVFVHPRQVDTV
uniref:Uncharacterized protein n=1 Tax=Arundo donax TaxID=35708 RepID=A0A0A8ZCZ9_ARUDO